MATRVFFSTAGGPEVLQTETIDVGTPGPNQVRLRQIACGVNFIDTYQRSGLYPLPLPSGLGLEATGVVEAVGEAVTDFAVGDRVAYGNGPIGGYASERLIGVETLVSLPQTLDPVAVAGNLLRGLTVQYLTRRLFRVEPGMTVLFHAAAGGVGLIACQWLKALGATVIGTVGSEAKAEVARAHGCDYPIIYTRDDFVARVREITDGKGVPVVYDGVGASVFEKSLDCLARFGTMATFGNASGAVTSINPLLLSAKGSIFLTRPRLGDYTATRAELCTGAKDFFDIVASGKVHLEVGQNYPLSEARKAHEGLEARRTTGATVLLP